MDDKSASSCRSRSDKSSFFVATISTVSLYSSRLDRYDKTTLVIESPAIATLAVSGLYHIGDDEGFAWAIARMYHLDLDERDGRIYLKSR